MSKSYDEAKPRIPSQRERIIINLKQAGEKGLTNIDLLSMTKSLTARMSELYSMGYEIKCTSVGNGVYNYVLISEPKVIVDTKQKPIELILEIINNTFDGTITSQQLGTILDINNYNIVRRAGYYKKQEGVI